MVDHDIVLITTDGKTMIVPITRKIRLGYRLRIASMNLYERDPDAKHDYVEQGELGCMTQIIKEK